MNKDILEKINYLKLGVDNAKTKETGWLPVPLSHLIPLLNELERINNLEPVGYIVPVALVQLKRGLYGRIGQDPERNSIPLYRLDK